MSYDVTLEDPDGKPVHVKPHEEGGTYVMGGTPDASLNVTYNYGWLFRKSLHPDGLRALNGMKAADATPLLEKAVDDLGTNRYEKDYWAPTPGNAGHALNVLLAWAREHPDATFRVE